ncbi:ABC transporter permease [Chloroflexota bacterium]
MVDNTSEEKTVEKRRSGFSNFWHRLIKEKPLGVAGLVVTIILLLIGILADFLAPYGFNDLSANLLRPPSPEFWMGTDNLGRDVMSRIIYGARISVIVGLSATTFGTFISVTIGLFSGYFGGKFDLLVQRLVDAWMCFPSLVLMMVIMSIIGGGMGSVIIIISLSLGIGGSRIIRGAVISIKENVYVDAARSIGCSTGRVLIRHILPNIVGPVIMIYSVRVPEAILREASLSFLGFGVPPPAPSWGGMLSGTGRSYMFVAPWLAVWPGLALSIVVYGVNMFGDAVRDLMDPRLRGGVGRYGVNIKKEEIIPDKQAV